LIGNQDTVILKWLEDKHGRVLWFLYVCPHCYEQLPDHVRGKAIEPPESRDRAYWRGWRAVRGLRRAG
jgi:hypothetical protein